jgi:hypothetical protein
LNVTCSRHDIAEKLLMLNNNHFDFFDDCSFKTCFQVWIYTVSVVGTLIILAILTFIGLFIYWRKKMSGFMMIFDRKVNTEVIALYVLLGVLLVIHVPPSVNSFLSRSYLVITSLYLYNPLL